MDSQAQANGSEDQLSSAVERLETALTRSDALSAPDMSQASQGMIVGRVHAHDVGFTRELLYWVAPFRGE